MSGKLTGPALANAALAGDVAELREIVQEAEEVHRRELENRERLKSLIARTGSGTAANIGIGYEKTAVSCCTYSGSEWAAQGSNL